VGGRGRPAAEYFAQFGEHLPQAITDEHTALVQRLRA
jgi:hypothetical protein